MLKQVISDENSNVKQPSQFERVYNSFWGLSRNEKYVPLYRRYKACVFMYFIFNFWIVKKKHNKQT